MNNDEQLDLFIVWPVGYSGVKVYLMWMYCHKFTRDNQGQHLQLSEVTLSVYSTVLEMYLTQVSTYKY